MDSFQNQVRTETGFDITKNAQKHRYIFKMASCEQNFGSCVINIGIFLHNKLFKGNGIMKHIMFVFIYLFI